MSANACTSSTGTVTGTDPSFILTRSVRNRNDGVFLYIKYTIGSAGALTITFTTKCVTSSITATDAYSIVQLSGSAISALTYTISASGNYKIPVPLCQFDDTLIVALTPTNAAGSGTIVANILEA